MSQRLGPRWALACSIRSTSRKSFASKHSLSLRLGPGARLYGIRTDLLLSCPWGANGVMRTPRVTAERYNCAAHAATEGWVGSQGLLDEVLPLFPCTSGLYQRKIWSIIQSKYFLLVLRKLRLWEVKVSCCCVWRLPIIHLQRSSQTDDRLKRLKQERFSV